MRRAFVSRGRHRPHTRYGTALPALHASLKISMMRRVVKSKSIFFKTIHFAQWLYRHNEQIIFSVRRFNQINARVTPWHTGAVDDGNQYRDGTSPCWSLSAAKSEVYGRRFSPEVHRFRLGRPLPYGMLGKTTGLLLREMPP